MASLQASIIACESRPWVLIHQWSSSKLNFNDWLETRFRLLEPNHPAFTLLSKSCRALVCVGAAPVTSDTLRQCPSLELVVGSSTGLDHIDIAECHRRGIKVTNVGNAFSEDVADYAVGLYMDVLRRISAADRFSRTGMWPVMGDYPLGSKLGGKRVGIVGLGNIGLKIAKRLGTFGCIITYNSRKKKPHIPYLYYSNVSDLAANSDALIVCCALTKETHHLINKDVMTSLGKNGIIINVGRGALINEKELVEFLVRGEIGGAGLDVYENEPAVPEELFILDNIVLSPHRAICTPESMAAMQTVVIGNLEAFFANKPLLSQIKFE
ncbi:Glyoxylate/hydroxypyruvate reductase HPR3 [Heracleum sosnowskyi]|uniref:Glyoxylate/hydroxypyruvate reductase HPR3 n=1 Tax=Heracleum sosnowskyi TaxID=360622 RepID=A0AAD8HZG8_9APIA|nr:Glyoxylate/hydroxypyruvate reductase HPR3 [Heracleum sosnowskyi]